MVFHKPYMTVWARERVTVLVDEDVRYNRGVHVGEN